MIHICDGLINMVLVTAKKGSFIVRMSAHWPGYNSGLHVCKFAVWGIDIDDHRHGTEGDGGIDDVCYRKGADVEGALDIKVEEGGLRGVPPTHSSQGSAVEVVGTCIAKRAAIAMGVTPRRCAVWSVGQMNKAGGGGLWLWWRLTGTGNGR